MVDVTEEINDFLKSKGVEEGLCHLFLTHTTAALTAADLDPGTDLDMLDAFEAMIPNPPVGGEYRHPHDPSHAPDHILSSLIGASLTLPIENGKLVLGTWQRVVLIEFDGPPARPEPLRRGKGPRERQIIITLI